MLVLFPLAQLTVALTVPRCLAGGAALSGRLAALLALGVIHKVLKHIRAVQFYHALHVFLCLFCIWTKKVFDLVFGNFVPIATVDDFGPQFRQNFNDK